MEVLAFGKISTLSRVDSASGVIFGVSVMTIGDAKGHNMLIDETTLNQALAVAQSHRDGIKVKFGGDHKAGVADVNGTLKTFRIEGNQLKADLHLLKSDPRNEKVLEMAQTMPDEFGLSMVFSGDHIYVKDGKAMSKVDENEAELRKLEAKISRCHEIYSVDLVSDPAANPNGLFSAINQKTNQSMKSIALALGLPETATEAEISTKAAEVAAFAKKKMEDDKEKEKLEAEEKKKLEEKDKSDDEKKEYSALKAQLVELSTKITAIETADKEKVALSHNAAVDALIAESAKEGKVAPAASTLYKLDIAEVKTLLSALPKGQVNLGEKKTETPAFKTAEEKVAFCRAQKEKGRMELNEQLKSLVN